MMMTRSSQLKTVAVLLAIAAGESHFSPAQYAGVAPTLLSSVAMQLGCFFQHGSWMLHHCSSISAGVKYLPGAYSGMDLLLVDTDQAHTAATYTAHACKHLHTFLCR
jgi:hypothetical protein